VVKINIFPYPFSDLGKTLQEKLVPAGKEDIVFRIEIPVGSVGFLYKIGVNQKENISWVWIIDNEIINEEIGTLEMTLIASVLPGFNPHCSQLRS